MATTSQSRTDHAEVAATRIVGDSAIDINGTGTPEAVSLALRILAEHDLPSFGFNDPKASGPNLEIWTEHARSSKFSPDTLVPWPRSTWLPVFSARSAYSPQELQSRSR